MARAFVRRRCAALGIGGSATTDIVQAVDEWVTNVIVHGYRGRTGEIEIEVAAEADGSLGAMVRDAASPFDPRSVPPPDMDRPLEARVRGGMGVHLMRESVTEMQYRLLPDGRNELTMIRRIGHE